MVVSNIRQIKGSKLQGGSLPDIDTDFEAARRPEIKAYMEERFGEKQVVSVGTFSTLKLKGALKDLDRQFENNAFNANIITSIIDDKDTTMLDLYKRSANEPKLKEYIKNNSDIFHLMPSLLGQPKSKSIHACAVVIMPSVMKSEEWTPVRKQNGLIVTEWGGGEIEDAGFLKEDILGIKQLDKFAAILKLIKENGKEVPDIYNLPHDDEVYRYFSNGWNGDVFQMGTDPLSAYTKYLKPDNIEDLIATVSLYRPGPMENNYHNVYVKCKNEGRAPQYLWGTEEITKDTYGILCYQEQIMAVCQQLGGLTMQESDDVRRAMGKKNLKYLAVWEERLKQGYLENGATEEQFKQAWEVMVEFAKYSFNRSHAAAYAITGYICQWLKVHYPIEYWTASLSFASESDVLKYLSEINETNAVKVMPPDINNSEIKMVSNMESKTVFWGIESIKGIGEATANQIIESRKEFGEYKSFADFYFRHTFKGSKVKKQTFEALISSGAFDILYGFEGNEQKRNLLLNRFRKYRKVRITNPKRDIFINGQVDKKWWWKLQQKKYTGIAQVDFKEIVKEYEIGTQFCSNRDFSLKQNKGVMRSYGGYVIEKKVRKGSRGSFAFITFESNYKIHKLILWSNEYENFKPLFKGIEGSFIIFDAELKYEGKWDKANVFTLKEGSEFKVLN